MFAWVQSAWRKAFALLRPPPLALPPPEPPPPLFPAIVPEASLPSARKTSTSGPTMTDQTPSGGAVASNIVAFPKREPLPRKGGSAKQRMRLKQSILDQLADNNKIIGRMKAYFPQEYALYSTMGAVIVPHDEPFISISDSYRHPVSPWFNQVRPGFGAVVTGIPNDETKGADKPCEARLTHFIKIEHPGEIRKHMFNSRDHATIQPIASTSVLYIFTFYYDERDFARLFPRKSRADWRMCKFFERAFAIELPLELTHDGYARPLKILRERVIDKPVSKKDFYRDVRRTVKRWDFPYSKECMRDMTKPYRELTPEMFILSRIGVALRCYEEASSSIIQVRASKNGIAALINVDVESTPDFFSDRDEVIEGNTKKRIFHIVRPHERAGSRAVKMHFRGLRQFRWNGYEIEISVPNRDHFDINEWGVAAVDADTGVSGFSMETLAPWLLANQKARAGAMVGKRGQYMPLPKEDRP